MADSCRLRIKAVPNARSDEVMGWSGEDLRVKVRAPALDGRANDALCSFLADRLGLPHRAVRLVHGEKSRQKLVAIDGLGIDEVRRRVGT
jgi:uncharacterized protein